MPSPQRSERGFTLLEVLVALAIMSLVMVALYSTLNASLQARDKLEREARTVRIGPDILDLIESDLHRAWVMDIADDAVFRGESKSIDGEPADALSFLTTVDSTLTRHIDEREVPSDVCETGYRLRRNDSLPDVRELWRRQSFHVDERPLDDGNYELLHDRVIAFQVRYFDAVDKDAEERTDWDAAVRHRLPALVQIDLTLEAVPRTTEDLGRRDAGSRALHYRRMVALGRDSDLRMRTHAIVPTFVAAGGTGGANPGAKGDGEGESGGTGDNGGNGSAGGSGSTGGTGGTGPKFPGGPGGSGGPGNAPVDPDQSLQDALNGIFGNK